MTTEIAELPANNMPPHTVDGEIVEAEESHGIARYEGVATLSLTADQIAILTEPLPDEAHEILPTGEVYVSQVNYRRILNRVFGPGGWAMLPRGPYTVREMTMVREYALIAHGKFISEAIGEAEYHPNNDRMTWATTAEAVKSNALTRCCKDLGIASECWDKRFTEHFKREKCIAVWRKPKPGKQNKPQWRLLDSDPFYDETGAVEPRKQQAKPKHEEPAEPRDDTPPESESMVKFQKLKALASQCTSEQRKLFGSYLGVSSLNAVQVDDFDFAIGALMSPSQDWGEPKKISLDKWGEIVAACGADLDPLRVVVSLAQINAPCDLPVSKFEEAMKIAQEKPAEFRKA